MASLYKIGGGKVPIRGLQFTNAEGERKTIRLGRIGLSAARTFKRNVELLAYHRPINTTPEGPLCAWVAGLSAAMHEKLAVVGLVAPREPKPEAPTLAE